MHNPKFYLDKLNFLQAILTDFLIFCMKLGQVKLIHRIWKTKTMMFYSDMDQSTQNRKSTLISVFGGPTFLN